MVLLLPIIQALPDFACYMPYSFSGLARKLSAALPAGNFDVSLPSRHAELLSAFGALEILVIFAFGLLFLLDPEKFPDGRSLLEVPAVLGGSLRIIL